jgi:hypothetical protein
MVWMRYIVVKNPRSFTFTLVASFELGLCDKCVKMMVVRFVKFSIIRCQRLYLHPQIQSR